MFSWKYNIYNNNIVDDNWNQGRPYVGEQRVILYFNHFEHIVGGGGGGLGR